MSPRLPRHPAAEALVVYGTVTALTWALTQLRIIPALAPHVHIGVAVLFLWVSVRMAQREPDGMRRFGIDLAGILEPPDEAERPEGLVATARDLLHALRRALPVAARETAVAAALALVIFPPFAVGFYLWHGPEHPFTWHVPEAWVSYALAQLLVVGIPEEMFFRGYLQTRLSDAWASRRRLLGVTLAPGAWITQAALFALMHFAMDLAVVRLAVFFPGLLFGWVRAWRGGIGASAALHAMSNLYSDVLVRGWL